MAAQREVGEMMEVAEAAPAAMEAMLEGQEGVAATGAERMAGSGKRSGVGAGRCRQS